GGGARLEVGRSVPIQSELELVDGRHLAQVPLVVREGEGQLREGAAVLPQVVPQVLEALQVGVEACLLRVCDEDDRVRPREHELARGVVVNLRRNREELEPYPESLHVGQADRQEVEVE